MEWLSLTEVMEFEFYRNPVKQWVIALALFLGISSLLRFAKKVLGDKIAAMAAKTTTDLDDFVADLIRSLQGFLITLLALSIASLGLDLPDTARHVLKVLPILALLLQLALWGGKFIDFILHRYVNSRETEEAQLARQTMMAPVRFVALALLWTILLLVALDNLGMNITALVAGLGVGGVAVALAVQNILGDLFAAMSIVIDKPFVIGDFIIVDSLMGNVEHIGLKTTRLRSLSGEQLIFSNSDLLKSRVRNFKRMFERRVLFSFGIVYQIDLEKLRMIPGMIREIVEAQPLTRFDRAHFFSYGPSSLDFEVVYYVLASEYNQYMDIQQEINLEIFRQFKEHGIAFAYPTQTVFVTHPTDVPETWAEPQSIEAPSP